MPYLRRHLTAEVCLRGHLTTGALEYAPQRAAEFCQRCGAETIRACPKCDASIRGAYESGALLHLRSPPDHCHACGTPFPWTTEKLAAAKEHAAELDGLDEAEKSRLQEAIDDLAVDGPRTALAVGRFKRLMSKAGQDVGSAMYKMALDVASEAAKKLIVG